MEKNDWVKWKDATKSKLNSLGKWKVFGLVICTLKDIKPIEYKWVFVQKQNEKGRIVRYKVRVVA